MRARADRSEKRETPDLMRGNLGGKNRRFLNYVENDMFLEELVSLIASKTLSKETYMKVLERHMETTTIRGAIREEYLAGMKLSRV